MVVSDYKTQFLDKAGTDRLIEDLKIYIDAALSGGIDLTDYVTRQQLQDILNELQIDVDLSAYATREEMQQAIASIDLSGYATTAYVDNAIANVSTGGSADLSNYYTKSETYNKEEVDNLIPSVTDGMDGTTYTPVIGTVTSVPDDTQAGASVTIDEAAKTAKFSFSIPKGQKGDKGDPGQDGARGTPGLNGTNGEDGFSPVATVSKVGNTATITITDKNGTTTASISDGADGTGGGSSGGGDGEVYSTEETAIGTWVDGRTIYRKVINVGKLGAVSNGSNFGLVRQDFSDTDTDVIIRMTALVKYATTCIVVDGSFFNINFNPSTNMATYVSSVVKSQMVFVGDSKRVAFYYGSSFVSYNCTMIIEYIKAA